MFRWILAAVAIHCAGASAMAAAKEPKGRAHPDGKAPAETTPTDSREAKERSAKKACLTGDPSKGVELLTDLFIETNDPTYIFNQGRCYEQGNQFENAVGRFREYLRKAKQASEAEKTDAKAHITECLRLLGKKDTEVAERPDGESPRSRAEVVTLPAPGAAHQESPPPPIGISKKPVAPVHRAGAGLRTAGIVIVSVGAAVLVSGVFVNLEYNSVVDGLPNHYNPSDESRSNTYKTMAIAAYGAGAACLAGGALLYVLGWNKGRVAVVPSVAAGYAGAALGGTF